MSESNRPDIATAPRVFFDRPIPQEGPPFLSTVKAGNKVLIYKRFSQEEEEGYRTTRIVFFLWAITATAYTTVRAIKYRKHSQVAHHMAKTWEYRCMSLKGRPTPPPPTPNVLEKFWYGHRHKFWAEHYDSQWEKMLQEYKERQKPSKSTPNGMTAS